MTVIKLKKKIKTNFIRRTVSMLKQEQLQRSHHVFKKQRKMILT